MSLAKNLKMISSPIKSKQVKATLHNICYFILNVLSFTRVDRRN